jgi:hypothetical protein
LLLATVLGFIAIGLYVADWARFGIAVLAGLGAFAVGGAGGFLFGIPRSDQAPPPEDQQLQDVRKLAYRPNTNLEQISDWLTKVLVGVGLTQFRAIGEAIGNASETLGESIARSGGEGQPIALSLLVWYFFTGFLLVYLWTRLYLPELFQRAERKAERVQLWRMDIRAKVEEKSTAQIAGETTIVEEATRK